MYNAQVNYSRAYRIVVVGVFSAVVANANAQSLSLTVDSQVGDWVGQGQHLTFNYTTATPGGLFMNNYFYQGNNPGYAEFIMGDSSQNPNTFSIFTIGTNKLGRALEVGTYLNAERASFASNGHAGLDFSFQNRGSNTVAGQFTINSIHYVNVAGTNVIKDLDVNFEQHSEGATPACFGHVVYNSGLVPEPLSVFGLGLGAAALIRRNKRFSR